MFIRGALFVCIFPGMIQLAHAQSPASSRSVAIVSEADEVKALVDESQVRLDQGDATAARQLLGRALLISPNSPEANLSLAEIFMTSRHYPEAMERFETVLTTNGHSQKARQGELAAATALAIESRRTGNQEAALLCLRHAREYLPDDPTLLHELGIQAFDMHLLTSATEALSAALAVAPNDPQNLYAIARVEVEQQQFLAAEGHFRAYLAARPDDASAYYGLGHLLQMQLRAADAVAEFERSIELQPQQTESYFQLGQIALDQHRDADARGLFNRTLSRAPKHGGSLTGLGILAYRSKDYASAAESLRKAIDASPDYQPAHYYLGLTLARLHNTEASERELSLATELAVKQQGKSAPVMQDVPPALP